MTPLLSEQYLDSFIDHEIHLGRVDGASFKLGRVEQLLKELGSPEKNLKVIHVAGSKGKGSIAAVIASILRAAGYSVGLYTSPH
ncbi:MAG: bifunctional folylpolyglutamate synthase/dihydrofolate synthase, partial [Candidatus Omnitrophica bacterium]|nr:bifunctional folylpolyglutamate synthase/dihydrofolate synthase [Candidatus Omnitrophota bacterium]